MSPSQVLSIIALLACGCASHTTELPTLADTHPANPHAPEAGLPAASSALRAAPAHAPEGAALQPAPIAPIAPIAPGTPDPAQARYVCPMHPEIVSSEPARCSVCGMKLVERASGGAR